MEGNHKASSTERKIKAFLISLQLEFAEEVTFKDLLTSQGDALPLDFVLNINDKLAVIEFNGRQHYHPSGEDVQALNRFNNYVMNGNKRIQWCLTFGVPFLVIHYKNENKYREIIELFIKEVRTNRDSGKVKYTNQTFGYFNQENSALSPKVQEVFLPKISVADEHMSMAARVNQSGFIELDIQREQIVVLPKTKIMHLLNSQKNLRNEIAECKVALGRVVEDNQKLSEELTDALAAKERINGELSRELQKNKKFENIELPKCVKNGRQYSSEFIAYWSELANRGLSIYQIADILDKAGQPVTISTLQKHVEEK